MTFEGAVIREQGITFAIVIVKPQVLDMPSSAEEMIGQMQLHFGVPVVLMAQDGRGRPTYYGRKDIARFMSGVPMQAVRWKRYTLH